MSTLVIRWSVRFLVWTMGDLCFTCMRPRPFCACTPGGAW